MNASTPLCAPTADAAFGPVVDDSNCRGGFDFTLVFEQSIFVLLPAALFLLVAPLRLAHLAKLPERIVAGKHFRLIKLGALVVLAALQLALLVLWATHVGDHGGTLHGVSVAATSVSFISTVMSCALSYAEHSRSLRPSALLNIFLLVSVVVEMAMLRTLWLSSATTTEHSITGPIRRVFTASFAVKLTLVVLEAREKSKYLGSRLRSVIPPESTSGIYSRAVFAWVTPLLRVGFQRLLNPTDLFSLDESMRTEILNQRFWKHWNQTRTPTSSNNKHRLVWTCIVTLRSSILAIIPPRLLQLAFTICQPLALNRFLNFLDDESQSVNIGYGLIGAYGLVYLGIAVSEALYWHRNGRSVTMLRGVLTSAIFSKATEISITATEDAAAVTLMSSDVDVITRAMRQIHEFWANIIQIGISTWLLSIQLGYAAAGPIIVSLVALLGTVIVSPLAKKYRVAWLKMTQKRVGVTSALVGNVKGIKMTGLTQKLSESIADLRVQEIDASKPFRVFNSITSSVAQIPIMISPVAAFAMFQGVSAQTGETLDATKLFAALSIVVLLAQPLFWMFEVVLDMSAAFGAFERIQKFLVEETREDPRQVCSAGWSRKSDGMTPEQPGDVEMMSLRPSAASFQTAPNDSIVLETRQAGFSWVPDRTVVRGITISIKQGQMAMLTGPVASGKSTLLKGLLGEVPYAVGEVKLSPESVSWCDQSPWILNQTIRDNIIGYSNFDPVLYGQVTRACDLDEDLEQLQLGDATVVGSKGLALSGGQKQRVALARAIYSRPRIALFDDIFSGLDSHTTKKVFANLFDDDKGLLRGWRSSIILATQTTGFLRSADLIIALGRDGEVVEQGTYEQLRESGGYVQETLLQHDGDKTSDGSSSSHEDGISEITDEAPAVKQHAEHKPKAAVQADDKRRQLGDRSVYRYYTGSIGIGFLVTLLTLEIVWAFLQSFPTVWLQFWTSSKKGNTTETAGYYLSIYAALQVVGVIWFALLIWFVIVRIAAKSGISLHNKLLHAVARAPLSLFTKTDLGSITTRFSQDIGMVDNNLPLALVVTLASFFTVIAKAALLAASSYYVAIAFPFLGLLYFYLQRGYLRTSRQLRFLDLEEKAPVFGQFLETLSGLATIRAFGWSRPAIERNHELVDRSQKPFYLLIMVQRWLVLVLDLTTTALALLVVGFAVYLRGTVSVGLTGVALVQLISMSETLNMLIQFWTSIETSIGAVARIKNFCEETPEENLPGETHEPPVGWPNKGDVVMQGISASYGDLGEIRALDGISIHIRPGEKVGICGRTGSGKSSLLLTLLRMLDPSMGTLEIDSQSLAVTPRETVRRQIITISQDHFVLPGTVRQNIDPFDTYTTEEITQCLGHVGLGDAIERNGGLDVPFEEDALSHGQKQLFFLARAVLRKSVGRLVLLDEATSSVDRQTEEMVRNVIDSQFKEHTVISIAHRLDTIIDFDRVIILENGCVVEEGRPRELLMAATKFRALWDASHKVSGN